MLKRGDFKAAKPPTVVRRSGAARLNVRGNFCGMRDSADRVVYDPALPGAPPEVFKEWMGLHVAADHTHVLVGPFNGSDAYTDDYWINPNLLQDLPRFRAFVESILDTKAQDGLGFTPILMLDGGGPDPMSRIPQSYPDLIMALNGLIDHVILCPAYEPVVGDWSSHDLSNALTLIDAYAPTSLIGWHGSPDRWAGSSNPVEPDDPWQGGESTFFTEGIGQRIGIVLYQLRHGEEIYHDADEDDDASGNYLNRWQDGVMRVGFGFHGWRVIPICAAETGAYEAFRKNKTDTDLRALASRLKRVADKHGVTVSFCNGLPL